MSVTKKSLLMSAGALALFNSGAFAQEQAEAPAVQEDTIIVTGVAKETTVFGSSASVSALEEEMSPTSRLDQSTSYSAQFLV